MCVGNYRVWPKAKRVHNSGRPGGATGARILRTCLNLLAVFATAFVVSACSSSLFTEDKGTELNQARGDGNFDKKCLGLDFSRPTLDVQTTRSLVRCLNSNGSIQAYHELVESLSDVQLQVVLDTLNAQLMTNHKRLKAVDASFEQMDERGILARAFDKLSKVLSNGKLIRSSVRLLRQGSSRSDAASAPTGAHGFFSSAARSRSLDPDIINSIKVLARELSRNAQGKYTVAEARETAAEALEMGVRTTGLKSYKAAVDGLKSHHAPLKPLRFYTEHALEYLKAKIRSERPLGRVIMNGVADGTIFQAFDYYYEGQCDLKPSGCTGDDIRLGLNAQVQAMEDFMRLLTLEEKETILDPMVRLFRAMDGPVECMAATKAIPNADLFVMKEISGLVPLDVPQWTVRTNTIKMKVVNSMCEFPSDEGVSFDTMIRVLHKLATYNQNAHAHGRPLVTVSHFLNALEKGQALIGGDDVRYWRFMIDWLGDKDKNVNVYTHLADVVGELSRPNRQVIGNVLYLLNAAGPGSSDRKNVQRAVQVLVSSQGLLGGRSLYDVLNDSIQKVDAGTLYDLFVGMSELIDSDADLVNPLLEVSRDALLMNDSNPIIEMALELGLNADRHDLFFETLFDIADTDRFEEAMKLTARMAANGTLRELARGILTMFRGHTEGISPPNPQNVPRVAAPNPDRDKSTRNRPAWDFTDSPAFKDIARGNSCSAINLDLRFGKPWGSNDDDRVAWENQVKQIAACSHANLNNEKLEAFLLYGVDRKVRDSQSFVGSVVDLAADLIPYDVSVCKGDSAEDRARCVRLQAIYDEFSDLMVDKSSFEDMKAMNGLLPFLFSREYCAGKYTKGGYCPDGAGTINPMKGLFGSLSVISDQGDKLQDVLSVAKVAVADKAHLPRTVGLLYDLSEDAKGDIPFKQDAKPTITSYPVHNEPQNGNVKKWLEDAIRKYEKRQPTEEILSEKIEAYYNQPLPAEELIYTSHGKTRMGYENAAVFKEKIKPLFDELAKDDRIEATMTIFYRMFENPYSPEWWESWFRYLSANVRAVPYYYPGKFPGKDKPTVRLINQLELLDLVVANADFKLSDYGQDGFGIVGNDENFGIKYLTLLGLCGEDMSPAVDRMERELAFFYSMSTRVGGLPWVGDKIMKPELKRRLFNLYHIFPILREVDKFYEFTHPSGKKMMINNLAILRDLFKAVLKALPPEQLDERRNKDLYNREKNPLAVIAEMVRFGILRNIAVNMWYTNAPAKTLSQKQVIHGQKVAHILRFLRDASVIRNPENRNSFKLNRDAVELVRYLMRNNCKKAGALQSVPCVALSKKDDPRPEFNDRYILIGKVLDQFFDWIKDDDLKKDRGEIPTLAYIKRAGYNSMVLLERIAGSDEQERAQFARDMGKILRPVLASDKGAELLAENVDLLEPLFNDAESMNFITLLLKSETSERRRESGFTDAQAFDDFRELSKVMIKELASNNGAVMTSAVDLGYTVYKDTNSRFKSAFNALRWMGDDAEYSRFRDDVSKPITKRIVRWFEREPVSEYKGQLRPRVQDYLATHLSREDGKIRDLLVFIGKESGNDQFYSRISFVGDRDYVTKFNEFLDLLSRGIVDLRDIK